MRQSTPAALTIEDLRVSFSQYAGGLRRRVIEPVRSMSLSVHRGQLVALIGASGAGKSLLAHAVLGVLPPNAHEQGTIRIHGEPTTLQRRRQIAGRQIALLPQSLTHLDPTATVGAQVRRSAELAKLPDPAGSARDALRRQSLPADVVRQYPHELSGGMARRVLIAMATLSDPDVLIADEPTPGLHAEIATETLARLRHVADNGTGVLLITHDLRAALKVADLLVICHDGRTIETATPDAFSVAGPQLHHPYSRELWNSLPGHGFHRRAAVAAAC